MIVVPQCPSADPASSASCPIVYSKIDTALCSVKVKRKMKPTFCIPVHPTASSIQAQNFVQCLALRTISDWDLDPKGLKNLTCSFRRIC
jgi:hypothetical protein